ncbi:MAG TPA: type II toxin-antitoxin system VapC family toxin [Thermoanaerobaculia bacterium]|nr:type II toxin-antitoxin system VapC family toxin [Thermoanaerobaculia bacterium]
MIALEEEIDPAVLLAPSRPLVVHSDVAVRAALGAAPAVQALETWRQEGTRLIAPDLWAAEAVGAIRRSVAQRVLSRAEGKGALSRLFALGIESVPLDLALSRQAFDWAERLGATRGQGAFYVALAERERATLWTANRRFALRARQSGAAWVRHLDETDLP